AESGIGAAVNGHCVLIAQSEIQRQIRPDLPIVLYIAAHVVPKLTHHTGRFDSAARHVAEQKRCECIAAILRSVARNSRRLVGEIEAAVGPVLPDPVPPVMSVEEAGLDGVRAANKSDVVGKIEVAAAISAPG